MKKLFVLICVACLFAACKKGGVKPPAQHAGVITGYDLRLCPSPACGGLLITIKNDTANKQPLYYHINSTLEQMGIDPNHKFPIDVNLSYKPDTGIYYTYHYIVVTYIKIVQ